MISTVVIANWFNRFRKPIRNWLRSKQNIPPGDIDDLAQEVFVRLLRYSDKQIVENPAGYLFKIAHNVATEWRTRSRIKCPHEPEWLDALESSQNIESEFEREQGDKAVQAVLSRMPPRRAQMLLLRTQQDMKYKEIAKHLGCSDRIVLRELSRGYAQLRQEICR